MNINKLNIIVVLFLTFFEVGNIYSQPIELKTSTSKFVTIPNSSTVVETKPNGTHSVHFNTKRDSTYYNSYNKLKKLYIAKLESPGYKIIKEKTNAFRAKMYSPEGIYPTGLGQRESILEWLKINWQNTRFKSYEEAVTVWNDLFAAHTKCDNENPEYNKLSFELIMEYGPDIIIELMEDIHNNYRYLILD